MEPEETAVPADESPEVTEETPETPEEEALTPEQIAELKDKAAKADELEKKNKQLYERAKKAEEAKKEEPLQEEKGLEALDALALAKADVHEDDLDEVVEYAKLKGKKVRDALKDPVLKRMLDAKAEERKTAAATQTKSGARGASKVSGSDLLTKAERTGELPESDEDMRRLAQARLERKKQRNK